MSLIFLWIVYKELDQDIYLLQELWNRHDHRTIHSKLAHLYHITHFDAFRWEIITYVYFDVCSLSKKGCL
jgi:hypothetical protein